MLALDPQVVEAVWQAVEPRLPVPVDTHPLGCHRRRTPNRRCFQGMIIRLVTGCSWDVAGRLSNTSETTLRRRRDEWIDSGVFSALTEEALAACDRVIGLELSHAAVDASLHKAPAGGEGTGPNFTDRAKLGWKWSLITDRNGIPMGWTAAGANQSDANLVVDTLDSADIRGLLAPVACVHFDKGYDYEFVRVECATRNVNCDIPKRRMRSPNGQPRDQRSRRNRGLTRRPTKATRHRWQVERTNSWLSNLGQLRRNTDRRLDHRRGALELAITFIITVKLVKWVRRWGNITT